ncbi:2-oxoacid:acceptor oxidoreductase subunit alpha [Magnetospirillum molischianum]|uniref:627aa long 2-oxoacid--ferredoxin oxidoreductasealpha subunit n=1 Tax=Magnetospirillum molischianum DSM 120 TaxID=1150626 RepID=H8FNQ8_MAGML|nr:2-oxoacid:acceptor oxidoreductase subunit alpha [Magnetospirillum molischianum]CCG39996.1 627aa long 2-oxoacid--ferredoxin oxidoreductasealpha subunit [Magnetospirillum molischianum DSM 120]
MTISSGSVSIALCGSGGAGVMTAANMLVDAAAQAGYYALFSRSSGPQIRGGEAAALLRLSAEPITSVDDTFQILLAIDWLNVARFAAELPLNGESLILADPAAGEVPEVLTRSGARIVDLPMKDLAQTIPGGRPNMIALGVVAALIGLGVEPVAEVLGKSLKKKHADAFEASLAAVRHGAETGDSLVANCRKLHPALPRHGGRWTISGNHAAGLGAIRGGIRFCAAYPITPATESLEYLSAALPKIGGVFVQAEDELASINMCIGASFGGDASITATAGPGLALMTEGLGLAVSSETPVVVLDVQRGGPSTGIPTKSEQSDLNIALYGLHGDAPHLVVAPQSIGDCLFTTQWAVHLAEAMQAPCIVLSDQSLGQSRAVIDPAAASPFFANREIARTPEEGETFKRYALTNTGVSPMPVPGTPGCQYTADGLEHAESGTPSSQASDHFRQLDKRLRKLVLHDYGPHWATIEGEGEIAVITWGSCTGAAREAVHRARADGVNARLIAPRLLYPIRPEEMARALDGVRRILVVEQSHLGQFNRYLRGEYDLPARPDLLSRPGPLPIRPGEIHARLLAMGK